MLQGKNDRKRHESLARSFSDMSARFFSAVGEFHAKVVNATEGYRRRMEIRTFVSIQYLMKGPRTSDVVIENRT